MRSATLYGESVSRRAPRPLPDRLRHRRVAGNLAVHDPVSGRATDWIGLEAARRSGNPQAIALVRWAQGPLAHAERLRRGTGDDAAAIDLFAETGDERLREAARRSSPTHPRSGDLDGAMAFSSLAHGVVRFRQTAAGRPPAETSRSSHCEGSTGNAARLLGARPLREGADSPRTGSEPTEPTGGSIGYVRRPFLLEVDASMAPSIDDDGRGLSSSPSSRRNRHALE